MIPDSQTLPGLCLAFLPSLRLEPWVVFCLLPSSWFGRFQPSLLQPPSMSPPDLSERLTPCDCPQVQALMHGILLIIFI